VFRIEVLDHADVGIPHVVNTACDLLYQTDRTFTAVDNDVEPLCLVVALVKGNEERRVHRSRNPIEREPDLLFRVRRTDQGHGQRREDRCGDQTSNGFHFPPPVSPRLKLVFPASASQLPSTLMPALCSILRAFARCSSEINRRSAKSRPEGRVASMPILVTVKFCGSEVGSRIAPFAPG